MAVTAQEIISDAFIAAGAGDQYNPLDATTVATALRFLNDLIDSYSTEELTIYDVVEGTWNLVAGQNFYQIGPGAPNPPAGYQTRPPFIDSVSIVDQNNVTYWVQIIGVEQWSKIIYKPAPGRPEVVYLDGNFPTLGSYWWPTPSFSSDVVHMWYGNPVPAFTSLTQTLAAPTGFQLFFKLSLAQLLCEPLKLDVTPTLARRTWWARNNARNLNNQPHVLETDVPFNRRKAFNIYYGY